MEVCFLLLQIVTNLLQITTQQNSKTFYSFVIQKLLHDIDLIKIKPLLRINKFDMIGNLI